MGEINRAGLHQRRPGHRVGAERGPLMDSTAPKRPASASRVVGHVALLAALSVASSRAASAASDAAADGGLAGRRGRR